MLFLNIHYLTTINNARKAYILTAHINLRNIHVLLENTIIEIEENDDEQIQYLLFNLHGECIQLDDCIYGLEFLSNQKYSITHSFTFREFDNKINRILWENEGENEKAIEKLSEYLEKVNNIIKKTGDASNVESAPDYSLSIKQFLEIMSDALKELE